MSVLSDLLIFGEDQILRMVESEIHGVSQIGLYFLGFSRSGRQVIEPGAKWIHVEPFWRGPEDGPIAIRPHRFAERP